MELLQNFVYSVLWGTPLVILILAIGIYFLFVTKFFQFRYFGYVLKQTWAKFSKKDENGEEKGSVSGFEALSMSLGTTVGVGNIAGVASAIALGGPGAVFWMWISGIIGQTIKMVEVSLAVHYRSKDMSGNPYGGPTYYMRKGLGKMKNMNLIYKILVFIFIFGFSTGFFITIQNYTISEAISSTFNLNMITVSAIFTILLYLMICGGVPGLAKIAAKLVPFMCLFYIVGGLIIISKNISYFPETLGLIFNGAFNGTAALGGFAGAAFAQVGMARAVYSNEAGWGSSPMTHAYAKVDHPIRQGLLGIFEVFTDTIIICSITCFIIIITGQWSSGLSGATLTLSAFEVGIGRWGRIIMALGILTFGITTSSGLYAQIAVLVRYLLGEKNKNQDKILNFYKWIYPIPGFLLVVFAVANKMPGDMVWLFIDMTTALPIFANILALVILTPKFLSLLKDYKARHMGIGKVNPHFKIFFDEEKKDSNKSIKNANLTT